MNRLTACCRVQTVRARSSDGERVTAYVVSTLYCGQGIPQSSISGPCVVINALIIQSLDLATACRYLVLWLKSRCLLSKKSGALTHCPCLFFFVSYKQVLIYIRQPHSNFSRQFSCHCYLDLFDPWNATDTLCPANESGRFRIQYSLHSYGDHDQGMWNWLSGAGQCNKFCEFKFSWSFDSAWEVEGPRRDFQWDPTDISFAPRGGQSRRIKKKSFRNVLIITDREKLVHGEKISCCYYIGDNNNF